MSLKPYFAASVVAMSATGAFAQETLPQASSEWFTAAQETIQEAMERQPNTNRALNVILMISDGNGVGTNYASRLFQGQQEGGFGDDYVQSFEAFPSLGLIKTYNVNAQTPDSAGTGTAMMAGIKTKAGVIGANENVTRGDCATLEGNTVTPITKVAADMGKAAGVISTARITHATPASGYAQTVDRNFEATVPEGCESQVDIAQQLIDAMEVGTIHVAMGGGMRNFHADEGGRREDGQNLIEIAQNELGAQFASDMASFEAVDLESGDPILGLFEDSHMMYEADREDEPSLAEMTGAAITALQAAGGENGFFLQVEAGRVDHANHGGNLARVVRDQQAFAEAVAMADEMTEDADTLIVVTADHEHAIAFNGYCGRGSDILGLCMGIDGAGIEHTGEPNTAEDGLPYTVAGYLNGAGSILVPEQTGEEDTSATNPDVETGEADGEVPSFSGSRPELTQEEATDIDYLQQALIPLSSETHSGEDVAVYAKGPWAHLFDGTMEQNVIFHVMNHAFTAGDDQ
ncbi:Alkaline phosphatase precursor [Rhodobacteraceae bacterium THAF1]|uniref:alkaline phosphatase n=1 Tax=Palleronia sp. THAF1 TaxID=2587842 RepID=UPI000F3E12B1|nr:alkaline phosphatase [Palleronia sp. THAF1]QFU09080.1 Alkaline phosphatase precursor [Palleronia sp. THAF1]VDC24119.1 Alkaline phosphatase precursor [Rhodobacteraceae bacterium THAF1]